VTTRRFYLDVSLYVGTREIVFLEQVEFLADFVDQLLTGRSFLYSVLVEPLNKPAVTATQRIVMQ